MATNISHTHTYCGMGMRDANISPGIRDENILPYICARWECEIIICRNIFISIYIYIYYNVEQNTICILHMVAYVNYM